MCTAAHSSGTLGEPKSGNAKHKTIFEAENSEIHSSEIRNEKKGNLTTHKTEPNMERVQIHYYTQPD